MFNETTLQKGYELQNWDCSYIIDSVQGQGGFGITYGAYRADDNLHVAVKEYFPMQLRMQRMSDGSVIPGQGNEQIFNDSMQKFLGEAKAMAKLKNIPSVVSVYSYFEANGTAYLVMEFIEGESLKNILRDRGAVDAGEFLPKFKTLALDIEKMHKTGLLHRDIAPDNIMLDPDGNLKLIDFGSARAIENDQMTVQIKPGFAPIEQYLTQGQGFYTDVYGVSATIYYCLTGKVPTKSPERLDNDPLVPPNSLGAGLTEEQQKVLLRGLAVQPPTAKNPGKYPRYKSMTEFNKEFPWDDNLTVVIGSHDSGIEQPADTIIIEEHTPSAVRNDSSRFMVNVLLAVVCAIVLVVGLVMLYVEEYFGFVLFFGGIIGVIVFSVMAYNSQRKG